MSTKTSNSTAATPRTLVVYKQNGVRYSHMFPGHLSRSEAERQFLFQLRRHVPAATMEACKQLN